MSGLVGELATLLSPALEYKKTFGTLVIVGAALYTVSKRRAARALKALRLPPSKAKRRGKHSGKIDFEFIRRLYYVLSSAFPFFSRETLVAMCLALSLIGRTFLTIYIAGNMSRSVKYLTSRNWDRLWGNMGQFVIVTIPTAMVNASLRFFSSELDINVREKITLKVHELYMKNMNYYWSNKVGVHRLHNADQLIAEDIQKFSQTLAEVYSQLLKPNVDIVIFTIQLGRLIGLRGPLGLYSYFAWAAWIASIVIPSYGMMAVKGQELEGNFRAKHLRLLENSEMVAFMGGEIPEKALLETAFDNLRKYLKGTYQASFVSHSVMSFVNKYLANIQGLLLILLPILYNEKGLGSASTSEIVGYYVETRQIMESVTDAVVRLFEVQKVIGTLAGLTSRVYNLMHALEHPEELDLPHEDENPPEFIEGDELKFENVSVYKPDGTLLVKHLNFEVKAGTRVIVTGENGAGKTSLFRVLRGLWPLAVGKITSPPRKSLRSFYFLSQVNFVPIGTLREIIIYPHTQEDFDRSEYDDEHLWKILEWAHIKDLEVNGVRPKMGDTLNWQTALSPGQKQRMAFARLLYHSPRYAVLDECTNGIQPDVELDLYDRCTKLGITVFSISHKIELKRVHDYELHYDGKGGWELKDLQYLRE